MDHSLKRCKVFSKSPRIRVIELCKGADRCRKPPIRLAPQEASHRASIGMHRVTKATFIRDWENWEVLKGRSLTEKTQPARLLVTNFGSPMNQGSLHTSEKRSIESPIDEAAPKRTRIEIKPEPIEPKVCSQEEQKETQDNKGCEQETSVFQGHGPKFLQLRAEDRQWLQKIHVNLGHPHAERLRKNSSVAKVSKRNSWCHWWFSLQHMSWTAESLVCRDQPPYLMSLNSTSVLVVTWSLGQQKKVRSTNSFTS